MQSFQTNRCMKGRERPGRFGFRGLNSLQVLVCLTRFGSCLRVTGQSTRHDPLSWPLHTSTPRWRGASARAKHHAAAARPG